MPAKNYSGRKKQDEGRSNSAVAGVILIVVSVFFLLCVTFSGFSIINLIIRNIVIGLIGYSAYPFFISLLIIGISLMQNRKASVSARNIVCILSVAICLIFFLQLLTTGAYMTSVDEYISGVFFSDTVGGVIFGIIIYGVSFVITKGLTYALLIIVMLALLAAVFLDIFGSKPKNVHASKRRKTVKEEPVRRDFIKGAATPNLVRTINNNGLFVEKIMPTQPQYEEPVISKSGKFDEIQTRQTPSLSKYGNTNQSGQVEFEKYHKESKKADAETRFKSEAHKVLFGQSPTRLQSYGTNSSSSKPAYSSGTSQSAPYSSGNGYDSQKDLFNRHMANYIPGVGSEPDFSKPTKPGDYGSKSDSGSVAAKYGLQEIAMPPKKDVADRFVQGAILNGDELSDSLRGNNIETETDNVDKTGLPPIINGSHNSYGGNYNGSVANIASVNNSSAVNSNSQQHTGIINGDYFNKQKEESEQREELRRQEEYRRQEEFRRQEDIRRQEDVKRQEELRKKEELKTHENQKLQDEFIREKELKRQEEARRQAEYEEWLEERRREIARANANLGGNSAVDNISEQNRGEKTRYDNDTVSSDDGNNAESSFEKLFKADRAINRSSDESNMVFDEIKTSQEDDYYQPFEKDDDTETQLADNLKNVLSYSLENDNDVEEAEVGYDSVETDEIDAIVENDSEYKIKFDERMLEKKELRDNVFEPEKNQGGSNSSFKILDEVIDKSETEFNEKYQTGYYAREGDDVYNRMEQSKDNLNIVEDFKNNVNQIERSVFNKGAKTKPENQINIEDYLKSAAPITEKPVVRRKKNYKYIPPPIDLLLNNSTDPSLYGGDCEKKAVILEETLRSLKFPSKVIGITKGPAVTRYEMETTPGIPIKRVESCAKDIAYALASDGKIRIETPIPGRRAVGVEVPNEKIATVCLRDIINSKEFMTAPSCLTLAVGKDITGNIIVSNLEKMPHLLIAGATGTGKSVCLNSIITSILYKASPEDVRLILIDPKRVEFVIFKDMPHLLMKNIITEPAQVINAFRWAKDEMERRYKLFSRYVNKNIQEFNNSNHVKSGSEPKMPYIIIIVDELSDLMMPHSNCRKELEDKIMSMAQKARAAGIHLILATQRPSVDVITGTIKANLPSRIAFAVTSIPDSRTILDQSGAEALLGKGDMLYSPIDWSDPRRVQGAFITSEEVEAVVEYVKLNNNYDFDEEAEQIIMRSEEDNSDQEDAAEESSFDPLMKDALRRVIETGQASTSMIQRRFSVGYARAARIMDQMELHKFVGPSEGAKPREVYITREQFKEIFGEDV